MTARRELRFDDLAQAVNALRAADQSLPTFRALPCSALQGEVDGRRVSNLSSLARAFAAEIASLRSQ